jgi:hypothetical protein
MDGTSLSTTMALKIPEENSGAIAVIKTFPSASLEKLISALKSASPTSNPREMAEHVAKQVPAIALEQLVRVIDTLYTLYYIRDLSGVQHANFISDLMEGIQDSPQLQHLHNSQKALPKLRLVLERLLSIDTLHIVSKAARLQRDGERLYCSAKIISDVRPVFGADPSTRPLGAVLTHVLQIGYHEGADHKEFHIILDSDDLTALGDLVRRAQAKDKSLREFLKSAELPNLGE